MAEAARAISEAGESYRLRFEVHPRRVRVVAAGTTVADSAEVLVLHETRLPPVYYFPLADVRMDLMQRTDHRTHCPFKGNASYWTLEAGGERIDNLLWGYEDPMPEGAPLAGRVAFYTQRVEACYEDDAPAPPAAADGADPGYEGNPLLRWLLTEAPAIPEPGALTEAFAREARTAGIPLARINVLLRTLHPQVAGTAHRWSTTKGAERLAVSYERLQTPVYLNSPLVPIYEGAGGIRRRLEGPDPVLDFGILSELRDEGMTDYVAMPLVFSDGHINVVTLASDRPGGFGTGDLGHVYEVLPVLARLYEVHAMRYTTVTLLDTYLGRHAGQRVLNGAIKRGDAESLQAVIWFSDLRDSTRLARSMPRDGFLHLLDQFFDCMAGPVLEHGGQVLRYIGDAALAIFPIEASDCGWDGADCAERERAGSRALDAAREARRRIAELNREREAAGEPPIGFGIGLHAGEVTYGNIGTAGRLEFTVIGEAANYAARVESLCKALGRDVLVSEILAREFPDGFEPLGRHAMAGVEGDQAVYALEA